MYLSPYYAHLPMIHEHQLMLSCAHRYSFPYVRPVSAGNMNYVSAVYAVVVLLITVDWLVRGRYSFRGQTARREEAEVVVRRHSSVVY